jgi:hypothetical protein
MATETNQRVRVRRPLTPPPEVTTATEVLPREPETNAPAISGDVLSPEPAPAPKAPRQPKAPVGVDAETQHELRQRIIKADPISFLIDVMQGRPLPVRDITGNVVSYERCDPVARAAAADRLLKRILPELKSVDLSATGGGGVTFVLSTSFPVPGGDRQLAMTGESLATGLHQLANNFNEATLGEDE